jgi:hypothetical protein
MTSAASQYGVSYPLHIVRCKRRTCMFFWLIALHWSFFTPLRYPQLRRIAAKILRLWNCCRKTRSVAKTDSVLIKNKFHCRSAVMPRPAFHRNCTPNVTALNDGQHGRSAWRARWFSNFKYCQVLLAHPVVNLSVTCRRTISIVSVYFCLYVVSWDLHC